MKRFVKMAIAGLLLTALIIPAFATGTQESVPVPGVTDTAIKIGTFQAMSGPVAIIGTSVAKGMQAYFEYINKQGGINGRKIELIIADDQFNPAKTVVETRRLVENDGVFAMVGCLGTPGVLAVMDYLQDSEVPFVYQGSGATQLAIPPKYWVFPFQPNYLVEGNVMVRYLVETKKFTKLGMIYRNAEDGKDSYNSVMNTIKMFPGVEMVRAVAVDPTATDFSAEIQRLAAAEPEAIIVTLFAPQTANYLKQSIQQFGLKKPLYLLNYANPDPTTIAATGADVIEGVEAMAWVQVDFTQADFPPFKWYQDLHGQGQLPNAFAVAGMIAAELFCEGVSRAGRNLTREDLVKGLESMTDWSGILAKDTLYKPYNENDITCRLGKQRMYPLVVKKGVWEIAGDWVEYKAK